MSDSKSKSERDDDKSIALGMIILLWVLVLGGGTWLAQDWLDRRQAARAPVTVIDDSGEQSLVLKSGQRGHYELVGRVNGQAVKFLIDTGASGISIPAPVAQDLGLQRGRAFEVMTANGTAKVYATRLDSLTVGPFVRENVRASINPSMDGDSGLLGMEFLRHFELLQRAGELTIRLP